MPETTGTLVIADISGYTKYVAGTEHEHSQEILTELMDVLATALEARVSIDQLEGDALCCTLPRPTRRSWAGSKMSSRSTTAGSATYVP